jgi:hypothetical protein
VSVIPVATIIASRFEPPPLGSWIWALAGTIAVAGGLLAMGVLPGADWGLTMLPQLLIGAGLAMALPILTAAAVDVNDPDGSRAASTIAARHAGIVVGIVLLTPVLSAQLEDQQRAGTDAVTSLLLDAPLSPETKVRVANEFDESIDAADGQLPEVEPAFAAVRADSPPEEAAGLAELEAGVNEQLERAATHAFTLPFLGAGLLALLALVPIGLLIRSHGHDGPDRYRPIHDPTPIHPPPPYPPEDRLS